MRMRTPANILECKLSAEFGGKAWMNETPLNEYIDSPMPNEYFLIL